MLDLARGVPLALLQPGLLASICPPLAEADALRFARVFVQSVCWLCVAPPGFACFLLLCG
jgi:hypothetical protein